MTTNAIWGLLLKCWAALAIASTAIIATGQTTTPPVLRGKAVINQTVSNQSQPSCSQPDADVQHQETLRRLKGYLKTAEDELARAQNAGVRSPQMQVQVDTAKTRIGGEEAYYACKTTRIANGCPAGAEKMEYSCRLCEAAVVLAQNPQGAPSGFQPDTSACRPEYLKGTVDETQQLPQPAPRSYPAPQALPLPPSSRTIQGGTNTNGSGAGKTTGSKLVKRCGTVFVAWTRKPGDAPSEQIRITWTARAGSQPQPQLFKKEIWVKSETAGKINPRTKQQNHIQMFQGIYLQGPDGLPDGFRVDRIAEINSGGQYPVGGVVIPLKACR